MVSSCAEGRSRLVMRKPGLLLVVPHPDRDDGLEEFADGGPSGHQFDLIGVGGQAKGL